MILNIRNNDNIRRHGVMTVVFSEDRSRILLLRREIFILWDLPGGKIEVGEDAASAAARECYEETGYQIEVESLIGRYQHQSAYGPGDQLTLAFRGQVKGGSPRALGLETTGLRWCDPSLFPYGFQPLHRQIVADAIDASAGPFEREIRFPAWKLGPARVAFMLLRPLREWIKTLALTKVRK